MTAYVDPLIDYGWRLGPSCHLYADSLKELHATAIDIGLKQSWFQVSKSGIPHYDLTESRRKRAVRQGAVEFTPTLDDLQRFKATLTHPLKNAPGKEEEQDAAPANDHMELALRSAAGLPRHHRRR